MMSDAEGVFGKLVGRAVAVTLAGEGTYVALLTDVSPGFLGFKDFDGDVRIIPTSRVAWARYGAATDRFLEQLRQAHEERLKAAQVCDCPRCTAAREGAAAAEGEAQCVARDADLATIKPRGAA